MSLQQFFCLCELLLDCQYVDYNYVVAPKACVACTMYLLIMKTFNSNNNSISCSHSWPQTGPDVSETCSCCSDVLGSLGMGMKCPQLDGNSSETWELQC